MKGVVAVITLCLVATLVISNNAFGKDANQPPSPAPRQHTVTGKVSVVKDKDGNITEIVLTVIKEANEVKYNITLNEKGKELAALDGKEAKVVGTVHTKEGAKWLTVISFEEITPAPPAPPKEAPK
jgi:hypothetical protein